MQGRRPNERLSVVFDSLRVAYLDSMIRGHITNSKEKLNDKKFYRFWLKQDRKTEIYDQF